MTNTLDTPLNPLLSWAGQGPRAVRINAAFLREIITARQQLEHNWHWNLPNYILKYYCSVPKMVLCVSPSSTLVPPPPLVPLFMQLRSANLTIFATPLTGDIWRSKLLSNYFVSCGNVATAASPRSGDSWRLTGLASLALASVICVQFAALRRMEIEKKLLVSFACVASSGNGDYSHKSNNRLHASAARQGIKNLFNTLCLRPTPCAQRRPKQRLSNSVCIYELQLVNLF